MSTQMSFDLSMARNELCAAVQLLLGPGTQRERLSLAFTRHLLWLRPYDFPPEWQNHFTYLINLLHINQLHGPVKRKNCLFDRLDQATYLDLALGIFELYDAVSRNNTPHA